MNIYCLLDPELIYDACKSGKDKDVTGDIIGMFPENIAAKNFQPQLSGKCYIINDALHFENFSMQLSAG